MTNQNKNKSQNKNQNKNSYKFFSNSECEYYPCHNYGGEGNDFNCLFCYCPLYFLADDCGGKFTFVGGGGVKDCSGCVVPHLPQGYDFVIGRLRSKLV
ncbi:MAG: cysteine-rich small domain-containing protein [Defluviitaleaceae bacterium]|nr:cysteine-rich small domain-containing protein [Defluviitaleaceae bacterium]